MSRFKLRNSLRWEYPKSCIQTKNIASLKDEGDLLLGGNEMKRRGSLFLLLLLCLLVTSPILAQDVPTTPEEAALNLRAQLVEVLAKEAERHARLSELDEALLPQNIERSLAGVGSTRPEELREQRRRQLTIERDLVSRQLELLATSRVQLESAIQLADNRAYQQSAQGFAVNAVRVASPTPRRLVIASVIVFGLLAIGGAVAFIRRR